MNTRSAGLFMGIVGFLLGAVSTPLIHGQAGKLNGTVTHFGFAVRDIDKSAKAFGEVFGVTVPKPQILRDVKLGPAYGGKTMNVKYTQFFTVGGVSFELLQNFDGEGLYSEHIAKYGEGFHHIGMDVLDVPKTRAAVVAAGAKWTLDYAADDAFVDLRPKVPFSVDITKAQPPSGRTGGPR